MSKSKKITVVVFEPGKDGYIKTIDNTLEACQEIVGGYIETARCAKDAIIICNEEGRLRGLPLNRMGLVGTFFICGTKGENFTDCPVPDKLIKSYA